MGRTAFVVNQIDNAVIKITTILITRASPRKTFWFSYCTSKVQSMTIKSSKIYLLAVHTAWNDTMIWWVADREGSTSIEWFSISNRTWSDGDIRGRRYVYLCNTSLSLHSRQSTLLHNKIQNRQQNKSEVFSWFLLFMFGPRMRNWFLYAFSLKRTFRPKPYKRSRPLQACISCAMSQHQIPL